MWICLIDRKCRVLLQILYGEHKIDGIINKDVINPFALSLFSKYLS
jgi:hypothetical protein